MYHSSHQTINQIEIWRILGFISEEKGEWVLWDQWGDCAGVGHQLVLIGKRRKIWDLHVDRSPFKVISATGSSNKVNTVSRNTLGLPLRDWVLHGTGPRNHAFLT